MDSVLVNPALIAAVAGLLVALTGLIAELRRWRRPPEGGDK